MKVVRIDYLDSIDMSTPTPQSVQSAQFTGRGRSHVTKENFRTSVNLNKDVKFNEFCESNYAEVEPINGYWLSKSTEKYPNGYWMDCHLKNILDRIQSSGESNDESSGESNNKSSSEPIKSESFDYGLQILKKITYTLNDTDANLLLITGPESVLKYAYQAPSSHYIESKLTDYRKCLQIVNEFVDLNKLDLKTGIECDEIKGVIVKGIDNKHNISNILSINADIFSITKSKTCPKKDVTNSCLSLTRMFEKHILGVENEKRSRVLIDWNKIKSDGYNGVIFSEDFYKVENIPKKDIKSIDDIIFNGLNKFLYKWCETTLVVWNWCFDDDNIEVEIIDNFKFFENIKFCTN